MFEITVIQKASRTHIITYNSDFIPDKGDELDIQAYSWEVERRVIKPESNKVLLIVI